MQFIQLNKCLAKCPAFLETAFLPVLLWQASHLKKMEASTVCGETKE